MPFPKAVRETALVRSQRRCCVCHDFVGRAINVHHIEAEADGGANTLENSIVLCLRCHAEAGHFNPRHPLGTKYSPSELVRHRDEWWAHCAKSPGSTITGALDIFYRKETATSDVHKYRLFVKYRNTCGEVHDGYKLVVFFPMAVPVDGEDFDDYEDVAIEGGRYLQLETEGRERIYPEQEIELVGGDSCFLIYEMNHGLYEMEGSSNWKLIVRVFTSNASPVCETKSWGEMHEF